MEFFCALSIATSKSMILKRFDNGGDGVSRVHLNPRRKATPKEESKQVAFIPFITADDPDLTTTSKALKVLDSYGSDLIKLGVPYSDPFVDGPVIQVVEVLNPLAREVKSIGTMKKELVELQEELANAHTLVYWFMEAVPKNPDALKLLAKEFHSGLNLSTTMHAKEIAFEQASII